MDDQRDYAEEEYNRMAYEKEYREEARYERLENLGLIPEEHNHGTAAGNQLECIDCHDERECESYDCLWCIPS